MRKRGENGDLRDMAETDHAVADWPAATGFRQDFFFRAPDFFRDDLRGGGTLAPFFLASLSPMAIACFRLVTRRPEPLFNVPRFFRCMADFTVFAAALPYLAIVDLTADLGMETGAGAFGLQERPAELR